MVRLDGNALPACRLQQVALATKLFPEQSSGRSIPAVQPSIPPFFEFNFRNWPIILPIILTRLSSLSTSHSQITKHCQPIASSSRLARPSLRLLPKIFPRHHSALLFGHLNLSHSWPCQKQPWTNIAVLYFRKTISGLPGSFPSCSLKRNPDACSAFLTRISGFVFLPRMAPIILLRVALSTVSANSPRHVPLFDDGFETGPHVPCNGFNDWNRDRIAKLAVGLGIRNGNAEV